MLARNRSAMATGFLPFSNLTLPRFETAIDARFSSVIQPACGNSRERVLNAYACKAVDRPAVQLMRQAGRSLPEYRALKEKHSFVELVRTPEMAAEVTLQP